MEASTTRNFWCLGKRRLASGAVVILAKAGGQLALEDARSDGIRDIGGGVHCLFRGGVQCLFRGGLQCLFRGGKGSSRFETRSVEFHVSAAGLQ